MYDEFLVRDMQIFADNDRDLYKDLIKNYHTYLNDKYVNNNYDREKALKLMLYFIEHIRVRYKKEFGMQEQMKMEDKLALAEYFLNDYEEEYRPRFTNEQKEMVKKEIKENKKEGMSKNDAVEKAVKYVLEDENRYTIASYNALIEEARTIKNFLKIYTDDEYIITKIGLKNSISYKDFKNVSGWEGTEKDLIRLFDAIEDKKIHIKYLDFGYDE